MNTFRIITVGGDTWESAEGTAAVVNDTGIVSAESLRFGELQGARAVKVVSDVEIRFFLFRPADAL